MMKTLTLDDIAEVTQGTVQGSACAFHSVNTDTRSLQAGDLFVALQGENFDAHDFLKDVEAKKAAGAVVVNFDKTVSLPQLVVKDTTEALGDIAMFNRNLFTGPLVGITGSCGKTTVKAMLKNIFEQASSPEQVLATQGNFNNHIGVPLTLFNLNDQHRFAVVEMGASGLGEIKYLSNIAKPNVVVVTNAMQAHVEGFGSLQGVINTKGELFSCLRDDGVAVVNCDDPAFEQWMKMVAENPAKNISVLTFGWKNTAGDITATDVTEDHKGRIQFSLHVNEEQVTINLNLLGLQNVSNALAAAACAHAANVDLQTIKQGLEATTAVSGRMNPVNGVNNSLIIDDSYNANPDSVKAAIDALSRWQSNAYLVLGDLGELGPDEKKLHAELGSYAKQKNIGQLITVGELTKETHRAFGVGANHCDNHEDIIKRLKAELDEKSVVLVKGSRVSKMDKVVAALQSTGEN